MLSCATCGTSLQRHCNTCPVRSAKEVVSVLNDNDAKIFNNLLERFSGAWKEMAKT
jgi:hypothetical protein